MICWPFRHLIGPASILMAYLLGVFLVASRYGKGASLLASMMSAPAFAFFFARPYFSIAIYDFENMIGLAVMMVVAYITGGLLEKAQYQAHLAERRVNWTDFLYRLSRELSGAKDSKNAADISTRAIDGYFQTHSLILLSDADSSRSWEWIRQSIEKPEPIDLDLAQLAWRTGQVTRQIDLNYYPLNGSQDRYGVLAITANPALFVSGEEMAACTETLSHLIAQTLERLRLETQAKEAALQADCEMLRNSLLSSISHDLRTPLTRIVGAANTLLEKKPELRPDDRQELKLIVDEAEHMSELTEKLLNMAKLASGQIVLHQDWNAIEEIVGSVLFRLNKNLSGRPVRTHLPDRLPLIRVDAVLMEQVLLNLIENAIKYTPSGSPIDIEANATPESFRITVVDYGPGLSKETMTNLFDKFYRGNPESEQSGVGLGLALCKAIINAHGGQICAANRAGKGAEFIIDLPLTAGPSVAD